MAGAGAAGLGDHMHSMLPPPPNSLSQPMTPKEQGAEDAVWATLLTLGGPLVIWASVVVLASAMLPDVLPEGVCEGMFFGCQLTPRDEMLFTGAVAGVVAVPAAMIVAAIAGIVGRGRHGRRTTRVLGVLSGFALIAVVLGLLAVFGAQDV